MYWLSSSLISMGQISLLKLRSFRSLMGIPDLIIHENIKDDGKGFIATLKSGESGLVILPYVHYVQVLSVYRLVRCLAYTIIHSKLVQFSSACMLTVLWENMTFILLRFSLSMYMYC